MKRTGLTGLTLASLMAIIACGCASSAHKNPFAKQEYYEPQNFRQDSAWLPDTVRRVAVLPVSTLHPEEMTSVSRRQVDGFVGDAIAKTEMFEIIRVTPQQLKALTGKSSWSVEEKLPSNFFAILNERLGCEAVMFSELTVFKPYKPVVIGWKLHLIDSHEPRVWWASDLVFDSGTQAVANSAIKFSQENLSGGIKGASAETILLSPARFGQYTLAASLGTLQGRAKN